MTRDITPDPSGTETKNMLVNVANRYDPFPSPPRSRDCVFYSTSRPDFLFGADAAVRITVQTIRRPLGACWALSRNLLTTPLKCGVAEQGPDSSLTANLDMSGMEPGFYDLRMTFRYSKAETATAQTTFGWRVGEDCHVRVCPDGFSDFWMRAQQRVSRTALDMHFHAHTHLSGAAIGAYNIAYAALPESYDPCGELYDAVDVYKVDFASPTGDRVYGWFARPAAEGVYPGLLVLAGAGNSRRPAPVEHARHGYAALDIQMHGFPVDADSYPCLPRPNYTTPEDDIHYGVSLNALQAVSALWQMPGIDQSRIAAVGGSQGGQLALIVAALDSRIRSVVAAITHFSHMPWLRWTERMNDEQNPRIKGFGPHDVIEDKRTGIESYFDVMNFAPFVECPVLMNAGLIDAVSPPTGVYAAYRELKGQKQFVPLPNLAHDWSPAFDRQAWTWLKRTGDDRHNR